MTIVWFTLSMELYGTMTCDLIVLHIKYLHGQLLILLFIVHASFVSYIACCVSPGTHCVVETTHCRHPIYKHCLHPNGSHLACSANEEQRRTIQISSLWFTLNININNCLADAKHGVQAMHAMYDKHGGGAPMEYT